MSAETDLTDCLADLAGLGLNVPRWLGQPSRVVGGQSPMEAVAHGYASTVVALAQDIRAAIENIRDLAEAVAEDAEIDGGTTP